MSRDWLPTYRRVILRNYSTKKQAIRAALAKAGQSANKDATTEVARWNKHTGYAEIIVRWRTYI